MIHVLRRAHSGPDGTGCSVDEAALIIDLISLLIGGTTLAVVLYQLYESKRRVEIDFSVELRHIAPWPAAIFWVTNLGKTRRGFTGCWSACTLHFGGLVLDRREGTAGVEVSGLMCSITFLAVACTRSMYAW